MKIALIRRGDPDEVPFQFERLLPIYDALRRIGVIAVPIAFSEASVDKARRQILECDGALAWVDPLTDGVDRARFDELLREVSTAGVWVSAHPDVILKMGVKEVLVRTGRLSWGTDAAVYDSMPAFRSGFAATLQADRIRVLKQNRGNSNQGVWRVAVEETDGPVNEDVRVIVLEARNNEPEPSLTLSEFTSRFEPYFQNNGRLIDQAFQTRVGDGLVRCYMSQDKVIGFSEQFPRNRASGNAGLPAFGMAREKTMHDKSALKFQSLRRRMETEWTPGLQSLLNIDTVDLPVLWDADFLYGPKTANGEDTFVLCEINVSCVTPYPVEAADTIALAAKERTAAFTARKWPVSEDDRTVKGQ